MARFTRSALSFAFPDEGHLLCSNFCLPGSFSLSLACAGVGHGVRTNEHVQSRSEAMCQTKTRIL
eukprot:2687105-Pleurochrysis_carterae.AAC.5